MRGLAPPETLTGQVQRALDEWMTQGELVGKIGLPVKQQRTLTFLLERLVSEGRVEIRRTPSSRHMTGVVVEYRAT